MTSEKIKDILSGLGYKLSDFGNHWRTNAMYRGGQNPSALQIYKNSGVWIDYVKNSQHMPLESLIKATLQTNDKEVIAKITGGYDFSSTSQPEEFIQKPKVQMEKIYPNSILEKLLPHYKFYNKRGISSETLSLFSCGLATEGAMYQRFVFPIYNSSNQIFGFSGRDMSQSNNTSRPKWKHIGKKTNWAYPYFVPKVQNKIHEEILKRKCVILVESIGDALNLFEHGIFNVLVTFGTVISSPLMMFLTSFPDISILISLNNDSLNDINRGRVGSFKSMLKMLKFFNLSNLLIHPPKQKDFGEMSSSDFDCWKKEINSLHKNLDPSSYKKEIIELINLGHIAESSYKSKYFNE